MWIDEVIILAELKIIVGEDFGNLEEGSDMCRLTDRTSKESGYQFGIEGAINDLRNPSPI